MTIVFVHPPVSQHNIPGRAEYWEAFDSKYSSVHPNFRPLRKIMWELPHWIPWLAGVLVSHGYESIKVLELYRDYGTLGGIDEIGIRQRIKDCPGDVYLFSPMTTNLPQALQIAGIIKDVHQDALIVFGGVVATPLCRELAANRNVDFVVRGRGEIALPALINALKNSEDLPTVGNLSYEYNGTVITNPHAYRSLAPTEIPFPLVSIFDPDVGLDIRYLRENYALGCPFTCDFCTIQTIGASPSYFPITRVLREIRAYQDRYGTHHHVYFGDETFTLNADRTLDLCRALAVEGDIFFDCQTRLNCLRNPDLPNAMYRAGCRWLEIGLETVSQTSQDLLKQHTSVNSLRQTLTRLHDEGIPTCTFTMIGLPNETVSDMQRTIDNVCELISEGLLTASYVSVFVPYPGTKMYANPDRYNIRIIHHRYDEYHEDLPLVFESSKAPGEKVYGLFLEALQLLTQAFSGPPPKRGISSTRQVSRYT